MNEKIMWRYFLLQGNVETSYEEGTAPLAVDYILPNNYGVNSTEKAIWRTDAQTERCRIWALLDELK